MTIGSTFKNQFANPANEFRGKPFWAWNGKLDPQKLRRQIGTLKKMGFGGFFMHARVGLDTPYLSKEWFDCITACIDEAGKTGMEAWLYDEDRWPSGAAGGIVTKDPAFRQRKLKIDLFTKAIMPQWDKDLLALFTARRKGTTLSAIEPVARGTSMVRPPKGGIVLSFSRMVEPCTPWYNGYAYLDTLNPKAVAQFIKVTHEVYKTQAGRHFGKLVPGIFTDEPSYGCVCLSSSAPLQLPWTDGLPQIFKERYGYDLIERLPALVFDLDGVELPAVRCHYFDCITNLFANSFSRQIGEWCKKNHIDLTGHVMHEERLSFQTRFVGSAMRFYEHMQVPGIDVLTEYTRQYDAAKQVSSVARQFGRKYRLSELYGCTGWDFPFRGHKALGDWQAALGINLRCHHLSWYTMQGEAKRDYPASIFHHCPWWKEYGVVEDYFARINAVMTRGVEVRDLMMINPIESLWAQVRLNADD
ncbi:MAG: glycosyl hydrolase, partial [Chitinivibrionales bacterium]|nr:glycosyl hydrolase [Chitinivibrionales bacterium]